MSDRFDDRESETQQLPIEGTGSSTIVETTQENTAQSANLLVNGSFEQPDIADDSISAFSSIEGWTDHAGEQFLLGSELADFHVFASDGSNLFILDDDDGVDGISQSVDTTDGQSYTLTFDARLTFPDEASSQSIEVVWNGDVVATITPGSTDWEQVSVTVTGTGGSDTLTLREPADGTQNDGIGALIDNVALVADNAGPVFNEIIGTDAVDLLDGTAGRDRITALGETDTINGSLGDDIIDGGPGQDRVDYDAVGSSQNLAFQVDFRTGLVSADNGSGVSFTDQLISIREVRTSQSNDTVIGNELSNIAYLGGGNDVANGGAGGDILFGEAGDDLIDGGPGNSLDFLDGGTGNDRINGGGGDDLIYGDAGNDDLRGDDGADRLFGEAGDDTIYGGSGDDRILGGSGNDTLDGGPGVDTYIYDSSSVASLLSDVAGDTILFGVEDVISLTTFREAVFIGSFQFSGVAGQVRTEIVGANTQVQFDADGDGLSDADLTLLNFTSELGVNYVSPLPGSTIFNILGLELNGSAPNRITGSDQVDLPSGTTGNDHISSLAGGDGIFGSLGNDLLDGGTGVDQVSYQILSAFRIEADLSTGVVDGNNDAGGLFRDALFNVENIVGADLNDRILGDQSDNYLDGRAGDDFLNGRDGDDRLLGGDGDDILEGGSGDDLLIGGAGNDFFYGNDGDDTLRGGLGDDFLYGGLGTDRAEYAFESEFAFNVNLSTQRVEAVDGNGATFSDILGSIEGVATSNQNDTVLGNSEDNFIATNGGDDVIDASGGDDRIIGGPGNDRITGGEGLDQFVYSRAEHLFGDIVTDFSVGDQIEIRGGIAVNNAVFIGSQGFSGTAGEVRAELIGFDTYIQVDIDGDGASDGQTRLINYFGEFDVTQSFNSFTLTGIEDPGPFNEITGTDQRDSLFGTIVADRIMAFGGDDLVVGSLANDILDGGDGNNILSYNRLNSFEFDIDLETGLATGADGQGSVFTDRISNFPRIDGAARNDTIRGDGAENTVFGLAGDDFIQGRGGNDFLRGGKGNDILEGGLGADRLFGDEGSDTLRGGDGNDSLEPGTGNDLVDGGAGEDRAVYILPDYSVVVNLAAQTVVANDGNGSGFTDQLISIEGAATGEGNDTIIGDSAANFIQANSGDDIIDAAGGNDSIRTGFGEDLVTGGDGSDQFIYTRAEFAFGDTITDFSEGDQFIFFGGSVLTDAVYIGSDAFSGAAGEVRSEVSGTDTLIQIDLDGDGVSDGQTTLMGYARGFDVSQSPNLFTLTGTPEPVNLLVNGSFEQPDIADDSISAFSSIEGWTDHAGEQFLLGSELADFHVFASDGSNLFILDDDDGVDGISQSVDTTDGQSYTLTFDARLTFPDEASSQSIEVVWNGDVVATITPGSTDWEQVSVTVTGTGGSDTLTLREPADGTQNDGIGALIDNVELVATSVMATAGTVKLGLGSVVETDILDGSEANSDFVGTVMDMGTGGGNQPADSLDGVTGAFRMQKLQMDMHNESTSSGTSAIVFEPELFELSVQDALDAALGWDIA